jgi:hypothetical protein
MSFFTFAESLVNEASKKARAVLDELDEAAGGGQQTTTTTTSEQQPSNNNNQEDYNDETSLLHGDVTSNDIPTPTTNSETIHDITTSNSNNPTTVTDSEIQTADNNNPSFESLLAEKEKTWKLHEANLLQKLSALKNVHLKLKAAKEQVDQQFKQASGEISQLMDSVTILESKLEETNKENKILSDQVQNLTTQNITLQQTEKNMKEVMMANLTQLEEALSLNKSLEEQNQIMSNQLQDLKQQQQQQDPNKVLLDDVITQRVIVDRLERKLSKITQNVSSITSPVSAPIIETPQQTKPIDTSIMNDEQLKLTNDIVDQRVVVDRLQRKLSQVSDENRLYREQVNTITEREIESRIKIDRLERQLGKANKKNNNSATISSSYDQVQNEEEINLRITIDRLERQLHKSNSAKEKKQEELDCALAEIKALQSSGDTIMIEKELVSEHGKQLEEQIRRMSAASISLPSTSLVNVDNNDKSQPNEDEINLRITIDRLERQVQSYSKQVQQYEQHLLEKEIDYRVQLDRLVRQNQQLQSNSTLKQQEFIEKEIQWRVQWERLERRLMSKENTLLNVLKEIETIETNKKILLEEKQSLEQALSESTSSLNQIQTSHVQLLSNTEQKLNEALTAYTLLQHESQQDRSKRVEELQHVKEILSQTQDKGKELELQLNTLQEEKSSLTKSLETVQNSTSSNEELQLAKNALVLAEKSFSQLQEHNFKIEKDFEQVQNELVNNKSSTSSLLEKISGLELQLQQQQQNYGKELVVLKEQVVTYQGQLQQHQQQQLVQEQLEKESTILREQITVLQTQIQDLSRKCVDYEQQVKQQQSHENDSLALREQINQLQHSVQVLTSQCTEYEGIIQHQQQQKSTASSATSTTTTKKILPQQRLSNADNDDLLESGELLNNKLSTNITTTTTTTNPSTSTLQQRTNSNILTTDSTALSGDNDGISGRTILIPARSQFVGAVVSARSGDFSGVNRLKAWFAILTYTTLVHLSLLSMWLRC